MKTLRLLIVGLVLVGFNTDIFSQEKKDTISVKGKVISNADQQPINSIWVTIKLKNQILGKSLTGDDGKYSIEGIEANVYKVYFSKYDNMKNTFDSIQIKIDRDSSINLNVKSPPN